MFVTFLTFTEKRASAAAAMAAHKDWLAQGFADGVFLCAGSLDGGTGGAILAIGESRDAYDARLQADPFVAQGIVTVATREIDPQRAIPAVAGAIAA